MNEPILRIDNCCTWFDVTRGLFAKKQIVKAVNGVSLEVYPGETLGLVANPAAERERWDGRSSISIPRRPAIFTIRARTSPR